MKFFVGDNQLKDDEATFEVIVKKNGEVIASTAFDEEETAYEVFKEWTK